MNTTSSTNNNNNDDNDSSSLVPVHQVIRRRLLDLNYKERWTYDVSLLNALLCHVVKALPQPICLHQCTQALLRRLYQDYRKDSTDDERWNAHEQRYSVTNNNRNTAAPPYKNNQHWDDFVGLCHELQHEWLPHCPSIHWSDELWSHMDSSYRPTYGYVAQVLQDLETQDNFLTYWNQVGAAATAAAAAAVTTTVKDEDTTETVTTNDAATETTNDAATATTTQTTTTNDTTTETTMTTNDAATETTTSNIDGMTRGVADLDKDDDDDDDDDENQDNGDTEDAAAATDATTTTTTTASSPRGTKRKPARRKSTKKPETKKKAKLPRSTAASKVVGTRVYACYPANHQWYWGMITRTNSQSEQYSVWFDDGEWVDQVPAKDLVTEQEYRQDWQHVFQKPPPKRPLHLQEFRIDEEEGFVVVDNHDNNNNNNNKNNNNHRLLSSMRQVGSRCYCKFNNGDYYWGDIVEIFTIQDVTRYSVRFEDGDYLENIVDKTWRGERTMYTEKEYRVIMNRDPPPRLYPEPVQPWTLQKLRQEQCKQCPRCIKNDCGRCAPCQANHKRPKDDNDDDNLQCCLFKMCQSIDLHFKKQPAPGLPGGWFFATGVRLAHDVQELVILAPDGRTFSTLNQALQHCKKKIERVKEAKELFESHLGGALQWSDPTHFLVGKPYEHKWTGVDGQNRVVYGTITECLRDQFDEDNVDFMVTFNEESRDEVNSSLPLQGAEFEVPVQESCSFEKALGGHLSFLSSFKISSDELSRADGFQWITPDMRHEQQVTHENGNRLPQLKLIVNGCRLLFTARESSIPNAGNGVFLTCTPVVPGVEAFRLEPNTYLDLGVYVPFRPGDLKEQCIFLLKNFVHGLKCEEWSFNVSDSHEEANQYDITDDRTGDLHSVAAQHIPVYVNECPLEDGPTVTCAHDPTSAVHYLLGTHKNGLTIPADGNPVELFINYGNHYETIRIRKNYSFLPPAKQAKLSKSISHESAEYLLELCKFTGRDVATCIHFFTGLFAMNHVFDAKVVHRSLAVAILLRQRACKLLSEIEECPFARAFSRDLQHCEQLIETLLEVHDDGMLKKLFASEKYEELINETLRPLLDELQPGNLEDVMQEIIQSQEVVSAPKRAGNEDDDDKDAEDVDNGYSSI